MLQTDDGNSTIMQGGQKLYHEHNDKWQYQQKQRRIRKKYSDNNINDGNEKLTRQFHSFHTP